jgi:hypothetical protein
MVIILAAVTVTGMAAQQAERPASPPGEAATQVNGHWIELSYGRPILRGRTNIFGSGADYGEKINDGGAAWRAGANVTTLLRTQVPLEIGGQRIGAGEYAVLIQLESEKAWTFILSRQPIQRTYDPQNKTDLYGAYNYTPESDVLRAPMRLDVLPYSVDQLTWVFTDVTVGGGTMRLMWERTTASVPFTIAR